MNKKKLQWNDWVFWLDFSNEPFVHYLFDNNTNELEGRNRSGNYQDIINYIDYWKNNCYTTKKKMTFIADNISLNTMVAFKPFPFSTQYQTHAKLSLSVLLKSIYNIYLQIQYCRHIRKQNLKINKRIYIIPRDGGFLSSDNLYILLKHTMKFGKLSLLKKVAVFMIIHSLPLYKRTWPFQIWIMNRL